MSANIVWFFVVSILATRAYCQEFVTQPENATVTEGDNITLKCVFSKNVTKCAWYRGSTADTTNINGRCHYLDTTANGTNTSNCSIQITPFEKMDETKWHCSGLVGSEGSEGPKSNFAYLTMVKSNESSKQENHPTLTSPTSSVTTTGAGPIFGLEKPYDILLMVGLGILATTFIFTLLMCYCRKATGKSVSELLTSLVTCRAIDRSYKDGVIDVTTPVQNVSQPATFNRSFVEEVNETEPVYDYPEIFQFRLQLQGMKRQPKGPEALKRPIQNPKSKGHKYVNVDNDDPGEDSDCHYLTPREYDPGEDTDDNLEEQHPEEPFYESPYHEISADEISARSPRKPVSPQQRMIQELQQHFQNLDKKSLQSTTVSKASPSCHCMKKCRYKPCKVPSNAVDSGKDHLPKKKFPKKRYENIPD